MAEDDVIEVKELELWVQIGVPEEERAKAQRLTVSLTLWPTVEFGTLGDQLERAVDYAAVADEVGRLAAGRCDKLIETLAEAIAEHLLTEFPIARVRVELRKFILPNTRHVAVILTRERPR